MRRQILLVVAALLGLCLSGPVGAASAGSDSRGLSPPTVERRWAGLFDDGVTPPDTTGAVGTSRYIQLVNSKYAIHRRTGGQLSNGTLIQLAGAGSSDTVFGPQVIWDPGTRRFYYAATHIVSAEDNRLAVGWSKTASPDDHDDFCHYSYYFAGDLPVDATLGDSRDLVLYGVNVRSSSFSYLGTDLLALDKPARGATCPSAFSLVWSLRADIRNEDGTRAYSTVAVNQTDDHRVGWALSTDSPLGGADFDHINLMSITRGSDGLAVFGPVRTVPVPSFGDPPAAPQQGTSATLDTLDTRLSQAVSGIDPSRDNKVGIWTQHTVAGGAGSVVRWYEINPAGARLFQRGAATHESLYVFNGAISPDRAVDGSDRAFGDSMVLGFNTSSAGTYPAIQMVSKIGGGGQSSVVRVWSSPGFNQDYSCSPCRWGRYSGATPDPLADRGATHGVVYLTNQFNVSSATPADFDWRTLVWSANP